MASLANSLLCIWLLSSPLGEARRVKDTQLVLGAQEASQKQLIAEMEDVILNDDSADAMEDFDEEKDPIAKCQRMKRYFEKQSISLEKYVSKFENKTEMSAWSAARTSLKYHKMAKTLEKANKNGCQDTFDAAHDKLVEPLTRAAKVTNGQNPCLEKAQQIMVEAQNMTKDESAPYIILAMQTMMATAPACIASTAGGEKHTQQEDEAAVAILGEETDAEAMQVATMARNSSALIEAGEKFIVVPVAATGILAVIMGVALCFISIVITVVLVGLILCVLKHLFKALIDKEDYDIRECIDWWLEAVGVDVGNGRREQTPAVLLAACAAPHILGALGVSGTYGGFALVR